MAVAPNNMTTDEEQPAALELLQDGGNGEATDEELEEACRGPRQSTPTCVK